MGKRILVVIFVVSFLVTSGSFIGVLWNSPNLATGNLSLSDITNDPIQPSNPTNVVIREISNYMGDEGDTNPLVEYEGVFYWEELAEKPIQFFVNTSRVIEVSIRDFENKEPLQEQDDCTNLINCYEDQGDKFVITPPRRSFQYKILAHYTPDVIEDTGFHVIFNSQTVDVSVQSDDELLTARTDFYSKVILPEGACIVSQSPIDDGFLGREKIGDEHWSVSWEYKNRNLHPHENPLMMSVTYSFDDLYLAFTEQVYQNQVEQQERLEEINRIAAIRSSFNIIASFALIASLVSTFFAYLHAKRKFEKELKQAQELPRIAVTDIEESESQNVPVKSEFSSKKTSNQRD